MSAKWYMSSGSSQRSRKMLRLHLLNYIHKHVTLVQLGLIFDIGSLHYETSLLIVLYWQ